MNLLLVTLAVFLINLPFGYWRANVYKYSLQWALAIHLPIPFIIFLRLSSGIGFQLYTYPILIAAFFMGQLIGSKLYLHRKQNGNLPLTSCLVMDIYRNQTQQ
jgi:hypothetical protein